MPPKPFRAWPLVLALLALTARAEEVPPPVLRPAPSFDPALPGSQGKNDGLVFIRADSITSQTDVEMVAEGHAEVRRAGVVLTGDQIRYQPNTQQVEATGNVRLVRKGGLTAEGPHGIYNLETHQGVMDTPLFTAPPGEKRPWVSRGSAQELDFVGENHEQLTDATFTTCALGRSDWYMRATTLDLDHNTGVGDAHQGTVDFYGVPILYAPDLSFPLNSQRKSGLLPPMIGATATTGQDISVPYYLNLAPNLDDTVSPRLMTTRGLQLGNEFRYLEPSFGGTLTTEYMQHDMVTGTDRWYGQWTHRQELLPGLNFTANVQEASDPNYLVDLSTLLGPPAFAYLPHDFNLSYSGLPGWDLNAHSVSYQTLVGATPQFRIEPQLTAHWAKDDWNGLGLDFSSQYTSFKSPGLNATPGNVAVNGITYNANYQSVDSGNRMVAYPTLALPWHNSYSFFTFKTGVNFTEYDLGEYNTAPTNHYTRTLPITSVDSGLFFDRNTTLFDNSVTQTLEPRMYYVYIPYRDQNQLPVFDTAIADFNRSTIFTENLYDGIDRINNANQITAAVTSRIIDPASGREIVNGMLAQRFYFTPNAVLLPGQLPTPPQASDVLISLAASITQRWKFDSYFNFDAHDLHTQQMMASTSYSPAPGKVFNLSYRIDTPIPGVPNVLTTTTGVSTIVNGPVPINVLTSVKQWDVSGEWPLTSQVSFLGRVAFSSLDNQVVEGLAGVEYNEGCWALRIITTRFAITSVQSDSAFYVQLEFSGMGGLGQNPMDALRRNIPGYMKTNEIVP